MDIFFDELVRGFKFGTLKKSFFLTWIFLFIGMLLFTAAVFASSFAPSNGVMRPILQSAGLLLAFSSLLASFAGVYRTETSAGENDSVTEIFKSIMKKTYLIIGSVFILSVIIYVFVFAQSALSLVAMIPYAGPIITGVISGIFFMCNIVLVLLFVAVSAVLPPLSLRATSFAELRKRILDVLTNNWLNVLLYLIVSISAFILAVTIIYYIARYALGITSAIQWKINAAYPRNISNIALSSFAVDIIRKITPSPDPIGAFMDYGSRIFDYVDMIKVVVTISYAIVASIVIAFPLSVFLRISALMYKRIDDRY